MKAAAVCVARKPPFGNEDPSVSPVYNRPEGKSVLKGLFAASDDQSRSMKASHFNAPSMPPVAPEPPRMGKNQCA